MKYGTGTTCQLNNMPVAGKTGTTDTYNDLWFVGYTPYYSCAVWSGYDNNEKIPDDYMSRNFHKLLWQKVMSRLHEDLDYKDFEQPPTVEKETVCSETGLLPRSGCPTVTEYFDITSMPTQRCDKHYYTYTPSTDYDRNDSSSGSSNGDKNSDTSDEDEDTTQDDPGTTPGGDSGETPGDDGSGGSGGGDTSGDNPGGDTGGDDSGGSGDVSGDSEGTS